MFGSKAWSDKKVRTGIARFLFFTKFFGEKSRLTENYFWALLFLILVRRSIENIRSECSLMLDFYFFSKSFWWFFPVWQTDCCYSLLARIKSARAILSVCVCACECVCVFEYVWARKCVWVWAAGCMFERERERDGQNRTRKERDDHSERLIFSLLK